MRRVKIYRCIAWMPFCLLAAAWLAALAYLFWTEDLQYVVADFIWVFG